MSDVTIYTKDYCGYCAQAKTLLQAKSVAFTEIDVTHDPDLQAEMMERSGRRTVPQIFVGGEHVGGFDDLAALDASGQLDPLLAHDSGESDVAAQHHRVTIVGTGPTGYTAAIHAARADPIAAEISGPLEGAPGAITGMDNLSAVQAGDEVVIDEIFV